MLVGGQKRHAYLSIVVQRMVSIDGYHVTSPHAARAHWRQKPLNSCCFHAIVSISYSFVFNEIKCLPLVVLWVARIEKSKVIV